MCETFRVLVDALRQLLNECAAIPRGRRAPGREGGLARSDRAIDAFRAGLGDARDQRSRRRVDDADLARAVAVVVPAAEKEESAARPRRRAIREPALRSIPLHSAVRVRTFSTVEGASRQHHRASSQSIPTYCIGPATASASAGAFLIDERRGVSTPLPGAATADADLLAEAAFNCPTHAIEVVGAER